MNVSTPHYFQVTRSKKVVSSPPNSEVLVTRHFTSPDVDVFDMFQWEKRDVVIKNVKTGAIIFEARNAEFPVFWSQNAAQITAEKYFRYVEQEDGTLVRENSVRQMVSRVVSTITKWAVSFGHVKTEEEATTFSQELKFLLVAQAFSFNSPVWFNIGTKRGRLREEQASACFINSIDDNMESILELGRIEGRLYKGGSGSGANYSKLRSSREKLSGGGTASGPVPFIAAHDAGGGAIKSGGTTRRAAKMNILNADHGDISEFVRCKATAERMAHALVDAGFDADFTSRFGAYGSVPFQNANHSVRVTDEFMNAVVKGLPWPLKARNGEILEVVDARALWREIAEAAWVCGDPGLQFDSIINSMHTCPADGRINASNPCSEYMHVDDSACNLASLNLRRFQNSRTGALEVVDFDVAIDVAVIAMDALIDGAAYPTKKIEENAHRFRQLGLGFANLGAFLMYQGIPYDSNEGRAQAGMITAIMCGRAYARSADLASRLGPFEAFKSSPENRAAMIEVVRAHRSAVERVAARAKDAVRDLSRAAAHEWDIALSKGTVHGFRNSQATVLAPTGTIAFMMDCDTTGIEPDVALVKNKKLVGGGSMKIVNNGVEAALRRLSYGEEDVQSILAYVNEKGSVVGSAVRESDYPIFDTAFPEPVENRSIAPEGHVLMMGAVQPFLSGAISKTCNMPKDSTVEQIAEIYMLAWKEGLKAIAIYRDGSKRTQPLENAHAQKQQQEAAQRREEEAREAVMRAMESLAQADRTIDMLRQQISDLRERSALQRRKLPDNCKTDRHKFKIGDHKGYLHMGMYPDGALGEIFIRMNKEGSTVSGLMDTIATLTSFALQFGIPLSALIKKFKHSAFEPAGWTENSDIGYASSIVDYIFRVLEKRFLNKDAIDVVPEKAFAVVEVPDSAEIVTAPRNAPRVDEPRNGKNGHHATNGTTSSGRICPECGHLTDRTGSCHTCPNCGSNTGCG